MSEEDRITQLMAQGLPLWEYERRLEHVTQEEIRFSRGFLPCDINRLLDGFAEHWVPLLLSLDTSVKNVECSTHLGSPTEAFFQTEISIDEEVAQVGFSEPTFLALSKTILGEDSGFGRDIILEYLIRRLLVCVEKSLKFEPVPSIKFVARKSLFVEPPMAYLNTKFEINGHSCEMNIGLGIKAIEYLDSAWRRYVTRLTATRGFQYSDQLHTVSIELAELSVEPSVLIDYVRAGTVVDLETPVGSPVLVRLNEIPWFYGTLAIFRGCYVVRAEELDCKSSSKEDGKTRVRIELAKFQLDQEGVIEAQQLGAMLATRIVASASANLIIGGEQVASASVHESSGKFTLTILPR